jgi:2-keto-4-pentenoate hydratase
MPIDARLDGSPPIQMYAPHYRRHPLEVTAEIFSDLRARGVDLPAGTFLLTGSLSLPTPIRPGQTLIAKFADFAPVSLTLT